jgi:hypothetical protein
VAIGFVAVGVLMVSDSRGEIADLVAVAQRAHRAELVRFAGGQPDRCVFASPGRELCRWRLDGSVVRPSGSSLADGPVNLVCELPADALSEEPGSCFVRAEAAPAGQHELPPVSAAADPVQRASHAAGILAEARTVTELSLIVGDAPDSCHTIYGAQLCRWKLDVGRAARERLSALAPGEGPLELRCLLPLEAVARLNQSCAVVPL